ncbi:hypothetical protein P7K49_006768 [Saguinus oedipus]|uniref:Uncharacterized protein n=1 Tax=Saguinus oedipus TaxID=9490 RepID=A0ABQ9W3B2_SAGOE|nr:hypothetical protein P7K49_006768 [Saguinus oedipus]
MSTPSFQAAINLCVRLPRHPARVSGRGDRPVLHGDDLGLQPNAGSSFSRVLGLSRPQGGPASEGRSRTALCPGSGGGDPPSPALGIPADAAGGDSGRSGGGCATSAAGTRMRTAAPGLARPPALPLLSVHARPHSPWD